MTAQSLTWAKTVMDTLFAKAAEPITASLKDINRVRGMLADEESRTAYDQELAYKILGPVVGSTQRACELTGGMLLRTLQEHRAMAARDASLPDVSATGRREDIPPILLDGLACTFYLGQYVYGDIVGPAPRRGAEQSPGREEIMLDCGGCRGDTAVWAVRCGTSRIFSFEIDPGNLEIMARVFSAEGLTDRAEIVPQALGAEPGTLWYAADPTGAGGGRVVGQEIAGASPVPVTTIDTFCRERGIVPTFVKMDIEGSEFDALRGAAGVIRAHRPRLAVCLYHILQDMWRIPLLVKALVPEYRLYCKKSHPFCEFVMFATCE